MVILAEFGVIINNLTYVCAVEVGHATQSVQKISVQRIMIFIKVDLGIFGMLK